MGIANSGPDAAFMGVVFKDLNWNGVKDCNEPYFKDYIAKVVACEADCFDIIPCDDAVDGFTVVETSGHSSGGFFSRDLTTIATNFRLFSPARLVAVRIEFFLPYEYHVRSHFPYSVYDLYQVGCDEKTGICKYDTKCFDVDVLGDDGSMPMSFGFAIKESRKCYPPRFPPKPYPGSGPGYPGSGPGYGYGDPGYGPGYYGVAPEGEVPEEEAP